MSVIAYGEIQAPSAVFVSPLGLICVSHSRLSIRRMPRACAINAMIAVDDVRVLSVMILTAHGAIGHWYLSFLVLVCVHLGTSQ